MVQRPLEIILTQRLASYLATPTLIIDMQGDLIFYNEAAEGFIGHHFEETGTLPKEEWVVVLVSTKEGADSQPIDTLSAITPNGNRPLYSDLWLRGADNILRHFEIISIPLVGLKGQVYGVVTIFWPHEL